MSPLRVLLAAGFLLLAVCLAGGEPGAAAAGPPAENKLPWPEPAPEEIQKIKDEARKQLPEGFVYTHVGPWFIITDLDAAEAARYANSVIAIYAAAIQRQLFTAKPRSEPVKVYLFKDRPSYLSYNKKLFGQEPHSPYGYYSRAAKALVMNIDTGGGTLLHEMTHAMAESDFPDIPAWLNEGLGSLFEASAYRPDGKIAGVTNWRLAGLQKDLKAGAAVKFAELLTLPDNTFYGERSGSNYASARYLMQYLQEKGLLETFYTRIRDKKDATALDTLRKVFGNLLTVEEIEKACYEWVQTLRFN